MLKRRGTGRFLPADPPAAVLERSCADVSVLAGLLTDKFVWHLPLHRQHQRDEGGRGDAGAADADQLDRAGH